MVIRENISIQNNSNNGDIVVHVNICSSSVEYQLYKEIAALNYEQQEMVLEYIKLNIKK